MNTQRCRSSRRSSAAVLVVLVLLASWAGAAWGAEFLWRDQFDTGREEQATAICANAHRVFAAGVTQNATDNDFLVRAYNAGTGALLWMNREDGGAFEQATAIQCLGDKVFAAGLSSLPPFPLHNSGLVRAYDAGTGAILWQDLVAEAEFGAIAAHGPRVFVSGEHAVGGSIAAGLLRAYDARSGALLWESTVGTRATLSAVAALGSGGFVAGGILDGASTFGFLVRAYDALSGELRWEDRHAGGQALAITTVGSRVIVAGVLPNAGGNFDPVVRAYDAASGALFWENRQAAGDFGAVLRSIAIRDGRVFASGSVLNLATNEDVFVRAYDIRTGVVLWEDQHDGGASDMDAANSLAVTGSRVAVAGNVTEAGGDVQFFVRAYDVRTGAVAWEDSEGGPDFDSAAAIVNLGNNFFAAGFFTGATQNFVVKAFSAFAHELAEIQIVPPHPRTNDLVVAKLSGVFPNSCIPMNPVVSFSGQEILIDTSNPSQVCVQIPTPWALDALIGQLSPGTYQVTARYASPSHGPIVLGHASFTVRP